MLSLLSVVLIAGNGSGAEAQDVSTEQLDIGIVKGYDRWLERYVSPVFCPVYICHGSCGAYDDACLLSGSQPVLSYFGELNGFILRGCGGACSQTHGQSDLDNTEQSQPMDSCCH